MKTSTTSWLLAGALLASLQWNLRQAWGGEARVDGAGGAAGTTCAHAPAGAEAEGAAASCALRLEALGLSDEQRARLASLCSSECARADADRIAADRKLAELQRALAAEPLDEPALWRLVREIGALRGRSLATCVDSVLQVRSILDRGQLDELLDECCRMAPADDPAAGAPER